MTQDYEQEINLIDLLGYMLCRWKWLVAGLVLGGLIGGLVSFCTSQRVIEEKYTKANSKLSEEDANGIKLLYDNFQILQQEIAEKELLLIERTVAVSDYFTKNIRVLIGDQKAYYETLAESNGQDEDISDEMQRSMFRVQQYRKTIVIGIIAGAFLILLGTGVAYLLGNKVRTGEDFATFSGSILLADFSAASKKQKTDFLTKWGYKLRGMNKKSAEDVMLLATEYVESLLAKEGVKTLYIVTDSEMICKTSDKDNEMLTDKTSDKDNAKSNSRISGKTNLEVFRKKCKAILSRLSLAILCVSRKSLRI